jgi:hypothetical protein
MLFFYLHKKKEKKLNQKNSLMKKTNKFKLLIKIKKIIISTENNDITLINFIFIIL